MPNTTIDYKSKLERAEKLLEEEDIHSSIRECGLILEAALRTTLLRLSAELDNMDEKRSIVDAEEKIGKGSGTVHKFGFGQLVGVYREANVEKILKRIFNSNFRRARALVHNSLFTANWPLTKGVMHQRLSEEELAEANRRAGG